MSCLGRMLSSFLDPPVTLLSSFLSDSFNSRAAYWQPSCVSESAVGYASSSSFSSSSRALQSTSPFRLFPSFVSDDRLETDLDFWQNMMQICGFPMLITIPEWPDNINAQSDSRASSPPTPSSLASSSSPAAAFHIASTNLRFKSAMVLVNSEWTHLFSSFPSSSSSSGSSIPFALLQSLKCCLPVRDLMCLFVNPEQKLSVRSARPFFHQLEPRQWERLELGIAGHRFFFPAMSFNLCIGLPSGSFPFAFCLRCFVPFSFSSLFPVSFCLFSAWSDVTSMLMFQRYLHRPILINIVHRVISRTTVVPPPFLLAVSIDALMVDAAAHCQSEIVANSGKCDISACSCSQISLTPMMFRQNHLFLPRLVLPPQLCMARPLSSHPRRLCALVPRQPQEQEVMGKKKERACLGCGCGGAGAEVGTAGGDDQICVDVDEEKLSVATAVIVTSSASPSPAPGGASSMSSPLFSDSASSFHASSAYSAQSWAPSSLSPALTFTFSSVSVISSASVSSSTFSPSSPFPAHGFASLPFTSSYAAASAAIPALVPAQTDVSVPPVPLFSAATSASSSSSSSLLPSFSFCSPVVLLLFLFLSRFRLFCLLGQPLPLLLVSFSTLIHFCLLLLHLPLFHLPLSLSFLLIHRPSFL